MKTLLSLLFILSFSVEAKDIDLSKFNEKINSEIDEVIKDNPQMYEKNNIQNRGRMPASVNPEGKRAIDQLDQIDEQADTHNAW